MQGGSARNSRPSVLVADDHEMFRAGLAAVFKGELGFSHIIEANDLESAFLELERGQDIKLATLDLSMPGVEGAASLNAIRRRFPDLLLVVFTASSARKDILAALAAGVHGYIPKALGVRQIAGALRHVLEGDIYVPASLAKIDASLDTVNGTMRGGERPAEDLTPRQRAVLIGISEGKSNKEIARALGLTESTVKVHVHALFRALDVHNRTSAAAALQRLGPVLKPVKRSELG